MSLGRRFVTSGVWATGAGAVVTAVLVIRSIMLARWLPVEVFGVYAFAAALVGITVGVARFGMGDALLHRSDETEDEQRAAAVHFTLTVVFSLLWAGALLTVAALVFDGPQRLAIVVVTASQLGLQLVATPTALLRRRVDHRLLATLRIVNVITSSAVALSLAGAGYGLWALLVIDVLVSVVTVAVLLTMGPGWQPRLLWDGPRVRYFIGFGARNLLGRLLEDALLRIDRLWIGATMGSLSLGLYSRASVYSRASMEAIGKPVASIATGAYAEIKSDRRRLSQAVSRVTTLLACGVALVAALAALVAPDLIVLLIGEKWLPMLGPFRILLAASVPAALNRSLAQLLVAVGAPSARVKVASIQLVVLLTGIATLGQAWQLNGVAGSVLLAATTGLVLFHREAGRYVDQPLSRLLTAPLAAALAALLLGGIIGAWLATATIWTRLTAQCLAGGAAYLLVLFAILGRPLKNDLRFVLRQLRAEGTNGIRAS